MVCQIKSYFCQIISKTIEFQNIFYAYYQGDDALYTLSKFQTCIASISCTYASRYKSEYVSFQ